jgi:hypothetical protein
MANVVFIHGIANKPAPDVLHRLWLEALARNDGLYLGAEGIESSMVYWADVMYESPKDEMAEHESNDSVVERADEIDMAWQDSLKEEESAWVSKLQEQLGYDQEAPDSNDDFSPLEDSMLKLESITFERIPLPWWLKRRLMKTLLRDVHHYLFNVEHSPRAGVNYRVQDEIRKRFIDELKEAGKKEGPLIVVSHSMGTVIAYDCLKRVPDCPPVDALMTIGCPLGIDEVQDKLKPEWTRSNGFPEKVANNWCNIYDRLDPVAGFDPNIANDYCMEGDEIVTDINEQNSGTWRHNISKYLLGEKLRSALAAQLKLED